MAWHLVAMAAVSVVDGAMKNRSKKRAQAAANRAEAAKRARLERENQRYEEEVRNPLRQELRNLSENKLTSQGAANEDEISRQMGMVRNKAIRDGTLTPTSNLAMALKGMSAKQSNRNQDAEVKRQRLAELRRGLAEMSPAERALAGSEGEEAQRHRQEAASYDQASGQAFGAAGGAIGQIGTAMAQRNAQDPWSQAMKQISDTKAKPIMSGMPQGNAGAPANYSTPPPGMIANGYLYDDKQLRKA